MIVASNIIVDSNIIVELPDILFDSMGDDPNLIFDGQNQHHSIEAYFVRWVLG